MAKEEYTVTSSNEARPAVTVDRATVVKSLRILSGTLLATIQLKELDRRNTLTVKAGTESITYTLNSADAPANPFASFV